MHVLRFFLKTLILVAVVVSGILAVIYRGDVVRDASRLSEIVMAKFYALSGKQPPADAKPAVATPVVAAKPAAPAAPVQPAAKAGAATAPVPAPQMAAAEPPRTFTPPAPPLPMMQPPHFGNYPPEEPASPDTARHPAGGEPMVAQPPPAGQPPMGMMPYGQQRFAPPPTMSADGAPGAQATREPGANEPVPPYFGHMPPPGWLPPQAPNHAMNNAPAGAPDNAPAAAAQGNNPAATQPADPYNRPPAYYGPMGRRNAAERPAEPSPEMRKAWAEARRVFWSGDLDKATDAYRKLVTDYPAEPDVAGELGNIYLGTGRPAEAADQYLEAGRRALRSPNRSRAGAVMNILFRLDRDKAETLRREMQQANRPGY